MRHVPSLFFLLLLCWPLSAVAQPTSTAPPCPEVRPLDVSQQPLHCLHLTPTPRARGAAGRVHLRRAETPFPVAVTRAGHPRFAPVAEITGLPDPATLGPYTTYIAWLTAPTLAPTRKLGAVRNGTVPLAEIDGFNKFLVLVTAEADANVSERTGPLVLRGVSPSSYLDVHDLYLSAPAAAVPPSGERMMTHADDAPSTQQHGHAAPHEQPIRHEPQATDAVNWTMPPMHPAMQTMMPGMMGLTPQAAPFLPTPPADRPLPMAQPRQHLRLGDGDTLDLTASYVRNHLAGHDLVFYAFNGQLPGPLLEVEQGATLVVRFRNQIDWPTAMHWHGLRLDNRYDGVPGLTQPPVHPGESFEYVLTFPDAGLFWYHPHHREDVQQDLGLYGNILVRPADAAIDNPVHRELVWAIDDILLSDAGLVPYGDTTANYMMMGRFGNTMLVNGDPAHTLAVRRGEVVRFYLTNTSNTRTYNLSLDGLQWKLVGAGVGRYAEEVWTETLVIGPAERYVAEVQFANAGPLALVNRIQAIDHQRGLFFPEADTLARLTVQEENMPEDTATAAFAHLRTRTAIAADIEQYRPYFDRPVDQELVLRLQATDLPVAVQQMMQKETAYFNPVEWSGTMPMMNWASTGAEIAWRLEDGTTDTANMDIRHWRFARGGAVKIRLRNARRAFHAMQHPIHIHGQRFLVLEQDGVPNPHLVWKDTMIVPAGSTADILLDVSNPGQWMVHCHIAEHLTSGMKMVFTVE